MDESSVKIELRGRAWEYFRHHATQRLTTFNFYIVISTLLATGLFSTFEAGFSAPFVGIILGALLGLFSFVFWKLDGRNRELIRTAEAALKWVENESDLEDSADRPHVLKVFRSEEYTTSLLRSNEGFWPWKRHLGYSDCFRLVFLVFGILGATVAICLSYVVIVGAPPS